MALKNRLKQHKNVEEMKLKMKELSTAVAYNNVKEQEKNDTSVKSQDDSVKIADKLSRLVFFHTLWIYIYLVTHIQLDIIV